ncbi:MAG: hypothetical protein ACR2LM_05165 [Pyrinomonadaceae bacterium]
MLKHIFAYALVAALFGWAAQERKSPPNESDAARKQQDTKAQPTSTPIENPSPQIDNPSDAASSSQSQERNAEDDASKAQQLRQNQIIANASLWMAIFAGLNLVVASVYAYFALKTLRAVEQQSRHAGEQVNVMRDQLTVTQGQLDAMKSQLELAVISERAYLRLRDWKVPKFENGYLILEAKMMNGGRTPAWGYYGTTRVGVDRELSPYPFPADEEDWPGAETGGAIGAGDEVLLPFTPLKVTPAQIKAVEEGEMRIFVDGACRYFDSLGGKQFYSYGFTLDVNPLGISPRYERHHRVKADAEPEATDP